jgi:hypothetical protein
MFHEDALKELIAIKALGGLDRDLAIGDVFRKVIDIWLGRMDLKVFPDFPAPHGAPRGVKMHVIDGAPGSIIVIAVVGAGAQGKKVLAMEQGKHDLNETMWKDHRTAALARGWGRASDI